MAIHLPPGQGGDLNLDGDHTFLDWVADRSLQSPPPLDRSEQGRRLEAAVKLVALRLDEYRQAVIATNGTEHAEERVILNARACFRRVGLAALLLGDV